MIKVKNVRPGVVIITDAGLKLSPGETRILESATRQTEQALADGLLAKVEMEGDSKPHAKTAPKTNTSKGEAKSDTKATTISADKPDDSVKQLTETPHAAG